MVPSVAFIQSLLKKGNGGRRIVHWKNALVQTRSGQAFRPDNATRGPFEMRLLDQSVEQQNGDLIDQSHGQPRPGARNQRETVGLEITDRVHGVPHVAIGPRRDRKSTRLNSSHLVISYAVFCLKKKNKRLNTKHRLN